LTYEKGGKLITEADPRFGGMSGVLYGLFGYTWMKTIYQPSLGLHIDPGTVIWLIVWFLLCMTGLVGTIANMAHASGLITGMLIGYLPTLWIGPED
jgi:GlpG protein